MTQCDSLWNYLARPPALHVKCNLRAYCIPLALLGGQSSLFSISQSSAQQDWDDGLAELQPGWDDCNHCSCQRVSVNILWMQCAAGEHEPVSSPKFGQERHGEKGLRVIQFTLRFSEGAKSGSPQFSWDQDWVATVPMIVAGVGFFPAVPWQTLHQSLKSREQELETWASQLRIPARTNNKQKASNGFHMFSPF